MPSSDKVTFRLSGFKEAERKLTPALAAQPVRRFMTKWAVSTQSDAKRGTPVNDGRLRASEVYEIESTPPDQIPSYARVGTNDETGPFIEGGTGTQADLPGGTGRRHWPPAAALEPWALKHGTTGKSVAFFIGRRGGLKPKRFLRNAFDKNERRVPGWLSELALDIERSNAIGGTQ